MWINRAAIVSVGLALVIAGEARADSRYVANDGVDSGDCGGLETPCRSLGRAIANASAGDTIIVGPGVYGDIHGYGSDHVAPGYEEGSAACGGTRGLVCIDKALTVESTHGSGATILQDTVGVHIIVDGVVFGRPGKGFRLSGWNGTVRVFAGTSGSSVQGNSLAAGAVIEGANHTFSGNSVLGEAGGGVLVAGTGHMVHHNVVTAEPNVGNGGGAGLEIYGSGHDVSGNVVISKAYGITVDPDITDVTIQGNTLIGNSYGASIASADVSFHGNNIVSNGAPEDSPPNCGLVNQSGTTLDATNNYWGAAEGPGPDPADAVCDEAGSTTLVTPVASQQFPFELSGGGGGDNSNPACNAAQAVPSMLWPANGQLVRAWIIGIGDPDNDPVAVTVTAVTQDEPTGGLVTGDTGPDAILHGSSVDLRAQRDSGGNGRVYRVQFSANDGNGGNCTGAVTVGVPNSQKPGQVVLDDGQAFDSTLP